MGWDVVILEVLSDLNDSMIQCPSCPCLIQTPPSLQSHRALHPDMSKRHWDK